MMASIDTGQAVYLARRDRLRRELRSGIAVFPSNLESPRNFAANTYPFRQDSTLLYFFGVALPGVVGVVDADAGSDTLYFDVPDLAHRIWADMSDWDALGAAGAPPGSALAALPDTLRRARTARRDIHFLAPARTDVLLRLAGYLDIGASELAAGASSQLRRIVISMREIKSPHEVGQIEAALDVTARLHAIARSMARPGVHERSIAAAMQGEAAAHGMSLAYQPICTTRGDILHNLRYDRVLQEGALLLVDAGAEAPGGYASDITRTLPVGGRFTEMQAQLYDAVYRAQQCAFAMLKPGAAYGDVHRQAARVMSQTLAELGIVRGSVDAFVESAGYAICFPHGLGHAMGLDVHDMESLGEDHVGYDENFRRDTRFGPNHLRLGKRLREGMVLTVEPGLYFIEALINDWQAAEKFSGMIDYDKLRSLIGFGGIRLEDNVLITAGGCRILGPTIPRSRTELAAAHANNRPAARANAGRSATDAEQA